MEKKFKKMTKAQEEKVGRIVFLIKQLEKEGVETFTFEDNLAFVRGCEHVAYENIKEYEGFMIMGNKISTIVP